MRLERGNLSRSWYQQGLASEYELFILNNFATSAALRKLQGEKPLPAVTFVPS